MQNVNVRRALPVHVTWIVGGVLTWILVRLMLKVRLGQDSHAYWAAWQGDWRTEMYDIAPGFPDAFNYAPAFAQAIWPLAQLPWPVFGILWSLASVVALTYLLKPLGWRWVLPLLLCSSQEILSGNIFWVLALVVAFGLGRGATSGALWAVPFLTKVTPALGPLWFAVRREWRPFFASGLTTVAIVAVSYALSPDLWRQWLAFLTDNESSTRQVGWVLLPALIYRLPFSIALTIWGALTNRTWTVPLAMALATPVTGIAAFTMLAAIPRLGLRAERHTQVKDPRTVEVMGVEAGQPGHDEVGGRSALD